MSPFVVVGADGARRSADATECERILDGDWRARVHGARRRVRLFRHTGADRGAPERMFLWLGAALLIDGLDGPLARRLTVAERLPRFSGERLDLVIDYLTYVFIPALALWQAGVLAARSARARGGDPRLLPVPLRRPGEQGRGQQLRRLPGHLEPGRVLSLRVRCRSRRGRAGGRRGHRADVRSLALGASLRVRAWRPLTLAALALWAGAAAWTLALGFPAPPLAQLALIAAAAYGVGLTLLRRRG